jgi:hypothetical protein
MSRESGHPPQQHHNVRYSVPEVKSGHYKPPAWRQARHEILFGRPIFGRDFLLQPDMGLLGARGLPPGNKEVQAAFFKRK